MLTRHFSLLVSAGLTRVTGCTLCSCGSLAISDYRASRLCFHTAAATVPQDACPEAYTTGLTQMGAYPMGVDPIWHSSKSELPYLNSVKMKMSILIGECPVLYLCLHPLRRLDPFLIAV